MFAYLIGTVGAWIIIAVAAVVAVKAGWVERARTALHHVDLPDFPSSPGNSVSAVVEHIEDHLKNQQSGTVTLWERGREKLRSPQAGGPRR